MIMVEREKRAREQGRGGLTRGRECSEGPESLVLEEVALDRGLCPPQGGGGRSGNRAQHRGRKQSKGQRRGELD